MRSMCSQRLLTPPAGKHRIVRWAPKTWRAKVPVLPLRAINKDLSHLHWLGRAAHMHLPCPEQHDDHNRAASLLVKHLSPRTWGQTRPQRQRS